MLVSQFVIGSPETVEILDDDEEEDNQNVGGGLDDNMFKGDVTQFDLGSPTVDEVLSPSVSDEEVAEEAEAGLSSEEHKGGPAVVGGSPLMGRRGGGAQPQQLTRLSDRQPG